MDKDPLTLLRKHLGYPAFRPGQEQLVRAVLNGRDAVGILPTGGGKSVCCQIPALALGGLTLVVTPLISLMEDQVRRAREVGLRAAHLSASQPADERRQTAARVRMGGLDVLFIAPERLEQEAFTTLLAQADIRLVAIDEAHCISEWGHDFRPSYRLIGRIRAHVDCPLVALTATATPAVRLDVVRSLALTDPELVVQSFDRPNLAWRVEGMSPQASRLNRIHQLLGRHRGTTIVYAPTRRTVEDVRDGLARRGHRCEVYHAGMSGSERTRVLQAFLADECRVVVATNAFAMGIDKPDVRFVVHLQLPSTLEAYYQEAGRAGRDGQPATCVALYAADDREIGRMFIDTTHPPPRRRHGALRLWRRICSGERPRVSDPDQAADEQRAARLRSVALGKLDAVQRYAKGPGCRRGALLGYFGEEAPLRCDACDRCASP